jgi:hypothetical protein
MQRALPFLVCFFITLTVWGQSFEMIGLQEGYKGMIGETVKAPVRFKNTTDKPIVLVIRKIQEQIGSTQRNFFCPDGNCLEDKITDYIVRLEPGQTLNNLQFGLEGGLVPGGSFIRYVAFNKSNPAHSIEFDLNFTIEEKPQKENIYQSNLITVRDVYPNPTVDFAYVNYNLLSDRTKAKIRVHNILGNIVGEYDLSVSESILRIKTEELNAGIYFYTLYLDNESVMTRKLIVKK